MIEAQALVKTYDDRRAVDGLSLAVQPGEILGLVGQNGAGKTTTLRCLSGIIPPTEGRVRIAGFDIVAQPVDARRQLAFVPDEPRLFEYLTAWDHVLVVSRIYGVEDGPERGLQLLHDMDLADRRDAFPGELSRGMKQKLVIVLALLHRPQALLLDEPLTGLDPGAMRHMRERIARTAAEGVAVILSSHLLNLVETTCSRVLIMARGRALQVGTLDEIRRAIPDLAADASLEDVFMRATGDDAGPPGGGAR